MVDLLMVGMFTAFFMAALESAVSFINMFISGKVTAIVLSLLFSSLGTYLLPSRSIKMFLITTVAGAFLGNFLIVLGEKITLYKASVVNSIK